MNEASMRTVDPQQRESKRRALLDAASRCFAEAGFVATRTADICTAAGMSAGNLFHYLASKHELLLALVAREGEQIKQGMRPWLPPQIRWPHCWRLWTTPVNWPATAITRAWPWKSRHWATAMKPSQTR